MLFTALFTVVKTTEISDRGDKEPRGYIDTTRNTIQPSKPYSKWNEPVKDQYFMIAFKGGLQSTQSQKNTASRMVASQSSGYGREMASG